MFSSVCLFRREAAISLEMPVMYIHSIAAYLEALQKPVCVQIKNVSWVCDDPKGVFLHLDLR